MNTRNLKIKAEKLVDSSLASLLPEYYSLPIVHKPASRQFRHQISKAVALEKCFTRSETCEADQNFIETKFLTLRSALLSDAQFIYDNDPAATSLDEVMVTYPGFYAIACYRIAHTIYLLGARNVSRLITEVAHSRTGIDIHPGAEIGNEFFIDHGTGIVVGETTVIGDRVKLYQGVTLGALSVSKPMRGMKRHPTVESDVVIYAGSTILGGETRIGHHSIIGGNVWLVHSVPPNSLVYHESKVSVREREQVDFTDDQPGGKV